MQYSFRMHSFCNTNFRFPYPRHASDSNFPPILLCTFVLIAFVVIYVENDWCGLLATILIFCLTSNQQSRHQRKQIKTHQLCQALCVRILACSHTHTHTPFSSIIHEANEQTKRKSNIIHFCLCPRSMVSFVAERSELRATVAAHLLSQRSILWFVSALPLYSVQ